ncbi:DNA-directed RNA polymerase subunit beta' [Candidatus Kuenenbacteria bacterium RIFCSPHIGHO2_02_FULL_39_13]|uniref:DNA-directed RNA polymerase subunit beta' n=1 Tax=Candidatus Kuenenbacteria bacterium RIFCSPHIGHO2_02_FULL_39_13 TaxID=1798561 RepID=A0A1F6FN89_9BACT|nr:MAG: DNA-directed RNA polymerase subunit beta' [Candidatus Kuenenbacteria bacterium RIFCSPHIGHO2_02_FULL_39_13]
MFNELKQKVLDFDSIRLKLASPEVIHNWSHGEVLKPETINYRTQKPEKDGLFCERIFGPTKDWECYCGKYKRIRYKGIICDKCGVEVTRSIVRRERMGHIDLVVSVSHIWFLRGVPSKLGLVMDISPQALEKVIYFADYIILNVNEELKGQTKEQVVDEYKSKKKAIESDFNNKIKQVKTVGAEGVEAKIKKFDEEKREALKELSDALERAKREIAELLPLKIISESVYQDLSLKYGHLFEAGIGAEAIRNILSNMDLAATVAQIEEEIKKASGGSKKKLAKRLKLLNALIKNKIKPEWMVIRTIPVIPPDLRPMVQLDGGRFAASDLNDLYRRVINRNNRLKKLIELNAPEVICRNEKRMLQEAVDSLIDNSARHGKTVTASTGQKRVLKSLADILKGKQGRFRQNLLGKRVDYSGRSVIVVGPYLKINECGLPKRMALELFKPFIIAGLIKREYVHNVRSANRFIESDRNEVWDILEGITKQAHVLLNRAPTLHRLGIQAFKPILIEGKAIQLHPLVCPPFNADFDGDQMAVHVPLTEGAKREAAELILSSKNILKPATGDPSITPSQDFVLGCYLLTTIHNEDDNHEKGRIFSSAVEARQALEADVIGLADKIKVRIGKELSSTSIGRVIFNEIVPSKLGFINKQTDKGTLKGLVKEVIHLYGRDRAVIFLDDIKDLALKYITLSGISWGMDDLPVMPEKHQVFEAAEREVEEVESQYEQGFLTNEERHIKIIEIWAGVKDKIIDMSKDKLDKNGAVFAMMNSGARGSWGQTTQMMGMRGLMASPSGETIELPVKASLKEGMDVLEYFITTHGARKGLSDTALRTANAGYLTRRLIDVAQDVIVKEADCGNKEGMLIIKKTSIEMNETIAKRVRGRVLLEDIKDHKGKLIAKAGEIIDDDIAKEIEKADLEQVKIRSILTCESKRGVCQQCYGWDLGHNELVNKGTAVGIVAAQSIGEPGTQLTMRTFHTGGVAGAGDITQGLPRVEEIFEARPIKRPALLSPLAGQVQIISNEITREKVLKINGLDRKEETFEINKEDKGLIAFKNGKKVKKGDEIFKGRNKISAPFEGKLHIYPEGEKIILKVAQEREAEEEINIGRGVNVMVNNGDMVERGEQLSNGPVDLFELYRLRGQRAVEDYIIKEIQYVYSSQGQPLNDKHVEVIIRQMFSKVSIEEAGDTIFSPGEVVERNELVEENKKVRAEGKSAATCKTVLLGITKSSLATQSFLSAASFQETTRVLIDAAITGKVDHLRGLKENVIIGKLIPAGTGFDKENFLKASLK